MGNIGGIEKIMVFGILVIIVAILAIAFYSAIKVENDITPNRLRAAGDPDATTSITGNRAGESRGDGTDVSSSRGPSSHRLPLMAEGDRDDSITGEVPLSQSARSPHNRTDGENTGIVVIDEGEDFNDAGTEPIGVGAIGSGALLDALKNNATSDDDSNRSGTAANGDTQNRSKKGEAGKTDEGKWITTHTLLKGDTFMRIARLYYNDERRYRDIMAANPTLDVNNLQVGQIVKLPEPVRMVNGVPVIKSAGKKNAPKVSTGTLPAGVRSHEVKSGESLVRISLTYYGTGNKWKKIWEANKKVLPDPDKLKPGIKLVIP